MHYAEDVSEGEDVTYCPENSNDPLHESQRIVQPPPFWSPMSEALADAAIANALAMLARHKPRFNPKR
ncbi:hypothetical protein [Ralstonia sp.]|uniref:hypothetical protein n=1 Tax=Ralstonia sp. TaxID=54061 RepID=UPI0031E284CE